MNDMTRSHKDDLDLLNILKESRYGDLNLDLLNILKRSCYGDLNLDFLNILKGSRYGALHLDLLTSSCTVMLTTSAGCTGWVAPLPPVRDGREIVEGQWSTRETGRERARGWKGERVGFKINHSLENFLKANPLRFIH